MTGPAKAPAIAVLVPCYNEEASIQKVVQDFRAALPGATVYVYDNNSTDRTRDLALAAGAVVRHEPLQGKGNVVRRMFADVEADVYVLVDGDDTYDASCAPVLIQRLLNGSLDMVNAARETDVAAAYRRGHRLGNVILSTIVARTFGKRFSDMLSGYRVFSRRFVKSFPALSPGFEIETELTVHSLELRMPTAEVKTPYRERPAGSSSKLRTFRDGFRILWLIVKLVKEERPMPFFSAFAAALALASYLHTRLLSGLPAAILSAGLMLLAFLSLFCGLILGTVTRGRREVRRMAYLAVPPPWTANVLSPRIVDGRWARGPMVPPVDRSASPVLNSD